jgi:FkbM family methyltransferase
MDLRNTPKSYLIRLLNRFDLLKHLNFAPQLKLNDSKIRIPIINGIGKNNYLVFSEPWMYDILGRLLVNPSQTFVDVGVNLGQTLLKVKAINRDINYIGFEPNPFCVNYVYQLIKQNHFPNTELWPVGLSTTTQLLKLNLFSDSNEDSSASIIEGYRSKSVVKKSFNVPVFSFSDLNIDLSLRFDVIKIDVEGAEFEVLKGLFERINRDRPVILMEVLPAYSTENTIRINRQENISLILGDLKYTIFRVKKVNDQFLGVEHMSDFGIHSDVNLCDYILLPVEIEDEVLEKLTK